MVFAVNVLLSSLNMQWLKKLLWSDFTMVIVAALYFLTRTPRESQLQVIADTVIVAALLVIGIKWALKKGRP